MRVCGEDLKEGALGFVCLTFVGETHMCLKAEKKGSVLSSSCHFCPEGHNPF